MCSEVAQRARQAQARCAEQPRPRHYGAAGRLPEAWPLQDLQEVSSEFRVCVRAYTVVYSMWY